MTSPTPSWVKPNRLDYLPLNERLAVVRLSAQITCDGWPRYPGLLVGAPHGSMRTLALGSVTHVVRRRRAADELLWRVSFAVPLDLVQCPQALFGLVAAGYNAVRLPDPWLATLPALSEPWPAGDRYSRFISAALARRAAALGTALAVVGGGYAGPLAAAAAGSAHSPRAVVLAPRQSSRPAPSPVTSAPASSSAVSLPAAPAPAQPLSHPHRTSSSGSPTGSAAGGLVPSHHHSVDIARTPTRSTAGSAAPAHRESGSHHHRPLHPASGAYGHDRHSHHRQDRPQPGHHRHGRPGGAPGERRHPSGGTGLPTPQPKPTRQPTPTPQPTPAPTPPVRPTSGGSPTSSIPSGPGSSSSFLPSNGTLWTPWTGSNSIELKLLKHMPSLFGSVERPPKFLIPIYQQAGARYHIPWQILAAINSIETDYGRDLNVSPAGAVGWMQFMPSTWAQYGVAVDHPGPPNPNRPADAIFSAARYLVANGGAKHIRQAIFAYNHAQWYVDEVLWRAVVINSLVHGRPARGFANPFPGGWVPNRLDMGYDGTFSHVLAAPFSGTITYAARSFSNWGGYVELRADHPIKGLPTRTLYFAEGLSPLFAAGTHVTAGTPIAKASPSPYGDAYSTTNGGQGQIEWGLAGTGATGGPTDPLVETGVANPAGVVKSFATWVVEHLGVKPPATTDHAGYP